MFLLDTCVLLWLGTDQSKIPSNVLSQISDPGVSVYISAISALEIGTKHAKGKLVLPLEPEAWMALAIQTHVLTSLSLTWEVAARAAALPRLHGDPADRIIIATANGHNLTIITPDAMIHAYPDLHVLW